MPQSSFNGWSAPNSASSELGWSASCDRSSAWIAGLGIDCTFTILIPTPSGGFLRNRHGNQAIKKPGLNISSTGITSVPGLFSELFYVAASRPAQMTTEWTKASLKRAFRQDTALVNRPLDPPGEEAPLRRPAP